MPPSWGEPCEPVDVVPERRNAAEPLGLVGGYLLTDRGVIVRGDQVIEVRPRLELADRRHPRPIVEIGPIEVPGDNLLISYLVQIQLGGPPNYCRLSRYLGKGEVG